MHQDTMFYSQAGQDRFVYAMTVSGEGKTTGTFLDVGCSDPVSYSNTLALEQAGWRGVLLDREPALAGPISEKRRSPFVCGDAKDTDWLAVCERHALTFPVDYLSFDVDGAGIDVFQSIPWPSVRFRILTVEHDAYRFGDGSRLRMRAILREQGYDLLCPDVMNDGLPFEDWWVDPHLVDMSLAARFRTTTATAWRSIVG